MKSTKELSLGKLYCIAHPEKRTYHEITSAYWRGLQFGYFISSNASDIKNMSNSQRFFLFLGRKEHQYLFFTSGHEVALNPGAVLSLKEVTAEKLKISELIDV